MNVDSTSPSNRPHYLLFSQARRGRPATAEGDNEGGWWHFLLESLEGEQRLEAGDFEAKLGGERLELLAVVRGLEALDQPSHVTLVTPSRYVQRGLRYGLPPWRENHWRWERFGELTPVKNADLWQRVDRALEYHRVECRVWRLDSGLSEAAAPQAACAVPRPHFGRRAASRAAGAAGGSGVRGSRGASFGGLSEPDAPADRDPHGAGGVRGWASAARMAVGNWLPAADEARPPRTARDAWATASA